MFLPTDITLAPGDSGEYVLELQRRLAQRSLLGEMNLTAFYDGPTTNAVMEFQSINGLRTDGTAGPETLRRLVSLGAPVDENGGGTSESEQEEEKEREQEERFDDLQMAEVRHSEQEKLANEAVWGPQQADAMQMQQEVDAQKATAATEQSLQNVMDTSSADGHSSPERMQERLDLAREHGHAEQMHSAPPAPEPLRAEPHPIEEKTAPQTEDQLHHAETQMQAAQKTVAPPEGTSAAAGAGVTEGRATSGFGKLPPPSSADTFEFNRENAASPAFSTQEGRASPPPPAELAPRQEAARAQSSAAATVDPDMARTEAQLDAPSRQESREEGRYLDERGVRNNGPVPTSELGNLSPARSPAIERERQVSV